MISVRVKRLSSGDIEQIAIDGHAGFAEPGKDIVCAAVSAISFGTINAINMQLGVEIPAQQGRDGFLQLFVPQLESDMNERIQLILDIMVSSLQSVASEYGKYIRVQDTQQKRRWIPC